MDTHHNTDMPVARLLKSPFVFIPLIAGVLLPTAALLVLRLGRATPNPTSSDLDLKDAVVISGKPLPNIDLLDMNGKVISSDTLRKGKVLLVFLTIHCQPCQKEFRLLNSVESEASSKVKIYGVAVENKNLVEGFVRQNEIKTAIALDQHGELMKSLSVKYFPTCFLVEDGVIMKTWFGNSATRNDLLKHLDL